jgi:hypothetical protein
VCLFGTDQSIFTKLCNAVLQEFFSDFSARAITDDRPLERLRPLDEFLRNSFCGSGLQNFAYLHR